MVEWISSSAPPAADVQAAHSYTGKYVLIGLTYFDHLGAEIDRIQLHGIIESVSSDGITVALRGTHSGQFWMMPPVLAGIRKAEPGAYTLKSTGETVENPDLLARWSVTRPLVH